MNLTSDCLKLPRERFSPLATSGPNLIPPHMTGIHPKADIVGAIGYYRLNAMPQCTPAH